LSVASIRKFEPLSPPYPVLSSLEGPRSTVLIASSLPAEEQEPLRVELSKREEDWVRLARSDERAVRPIIIRSKDRPTTGVYAIPIRGSVSGILNPLALPAPQTLLLSFVFANVTDDTFSA
jgi:hypothetical protein